MDLRRTPGHRVIGSLAALMFFIAAGGSGSGFAQELDTALRQQAESRFTVLDEIQDSRERAAFLKLYRTTKPEARLRLAEGFIETYPQSWLLGHAYEAAAKASIDLGSYDRAIQEAKQSLRLFPENTLLLVPLANVAAQQGLMPLAERTAKDALEYLDEFGPPTGTKRKTWPELRDKLKASAHFALGRVYASKGLAVCGLVQARSSVEVVRRTDSGIAVEWEGRRDLLLARRCGGGSGTAGGRGGGLCRSGPAGPESAGDGSEIVTAHLRRRPKERRFRLQPISGWPASAQNSST